MRAGIEPPAVSVFRLLSQGEGYSKAAAVYLFDFTDQAFYPRNELRITAFPALESNGAIPKLMGKSCTGKDFIVREAIPLYTGISAPEAAVQAVLLANVAKLYEPPQMDIIVQLPELHLQGTPQKALHLLPFRCQKGLYVLKRHVHNANITNNCELTLLPAKARAIITG